MFVAGVNVGDDEKLKFDYVGHVSRGSQEERLVLETSASVEGTLSVSLSLCVCGIVHIHFVAYSRCSNKEEAQRLNFLADRSPY